MLKSVHYINQFFGQVGGEEMADFEPVLYEGALGCTGIFNSLAGNVEVISTIVCGDNFFASRKEEALERILSMLENVSFDFFVAGPAFNAGRYGIACGEVCRAVQERFAVPAVTSMNEENPGVQLFSKDVYIMRGGKRATFMKQDMEKLVSFSEKIALKQPVLPAVMEGYFPRGVRHEVFLEDLGMKPVMASDRAFEMLLAKLRGGVYQTELPMPALDRVPIAPAVKSLRDVRLALVTSGGIVPRNNPDRIQSCSATKWGKYDISSLASGLPAPEYKTIHAGYDPGEADRNPNVVVPLDAVRRYQSEGRLGEVDEFFYTTVGTGTTQGEAARMGREIAALLHERNIGAVLLTAT